MYNSLLDSFLCVADCGSFSKAAEKLYISPTAVMKQMNLLEEHLGLPLISRTHQGVRLTPAGESIYKDAKQIKDFSNQSVKRARALMGRPIMQLRVGTSLLNPCKVFMDLWFELSDRFPNYKIQIIPFEDDKNGILSIIERIGDEYDFIVGVCDSSKWMNRCNFLQLGTYRKFMAVPMMHPLASKNQLEISDLYGETMMMVSRGDSAMNDRLRTDLEQNHPQIQIADAGYFYDISTYNLCDQKGYLLLNVECWSTVHPSFKTIPVNWDYTIPYGILYPLNPNPQVVEFIEELRKFKNSNI